MLKRKRLSCQRCLRNIRLNNIKYHSNTKTSEVFNMLTSNYSCAVSQTWGRILLLRSISQGFSSLKQLLGNIVLSCIYMICSESFISPNSQAQNRTDVSLSQASNFTLLAELHIITWLWSQFGYLICLIFLEMFNSSNIKWLWFPFCLFQIWLLYWPFSSHCTFLTFSKILATNKIPYLS